MREYLERMLELIPVVGLAVFGGLTRTIYGKAKDEPWSFKRALPEMIIAGFAGLIIHWVTKDMGMSDSLRAVFISMGGYSSRSILAVFHRVFIAFIRRNWGPDK